MAGLSGWLELRTGLTPWVTPSLKHHPTTWVGRAWEGSAA